MVPVGALDPVVVEGVASVEKTGMVERAAVVMVEIGLGGSTDAAKLRPRRSSSLDRVQACDESSQQLRPHKRLTWACDRELPGRSGAIPW